MAVSMPERTDLNKTFRGSIKSLKSEGTSRNELVAADFG
jgi:hypothetical protein